MVIFLKAKSIVYKVQTIPSTWCFWPGACTCNFFSARISSSVLSAHGFYSMDTFSLKQSLLTLRRTGPMIHKIKIIIFLKIEEFSPNLLTIHDQEQYYLHLKLTLFSRTSISYIVVPNASGQFYLRPPPKKS